MKPIRTQQRYQCDFCKKRGIARVMNKHEKHCVYNPDRVCGGCEYFERLMRYKYDILKKERRLELAEELKESISKGLLSFEEKQEIIQTQIEEIKKEVLCPSCILSIIALAKVGAYAGYDYKEEFNKLAQQLLDKEREDEYYQMVAEGLKY